MQIQPSLVKPDLGMNSDAEDNREMDEHLGVERLSSSHENMMSNIVKLNDYSHTYKRGI